MHIMYTTTTIGHVNNIATMQFFTVISRNTRSKHICNHFLSVSRISIVGYSLTCPIWQPGRCLQQRCSASIGFTSPHSPDCHGGYFAYMIRYLQFCDDVCEQWVRIWPPNFESCQGAETSETSLRYTKWVITACNLREECFQWKLTWQTY